MESKIKGKRKTGRGWRVVKGHLGKPQGTRPSLWLSQLGLRTSVLGHSSHHPTMGGKTPLVL